MRFQSFALVLCSIMVINSFAGITLVTPSIQSHVSREILSEPGVLRSGAVNLTTSAVDELATISTGTEVVISPFEGVNLTAVLEKKHPALEPESYTWTGHVKGSPTLIFSIAVCGEVTIIDIEAPDGVRYGIRYKGHGLYEAVEIVESALPSCGLTPYNSKELTPQTSQTLSVRDGAMESDTADEIDVLIAYTQDSETAAGGPSGLTALINQAFTLANQSYANSNVPLSIVKVAAIKVNYTPNVDMGLDLSRLQSANDGYMDEVHTIRDAYNADMVCLLRGTNSPAACGIGYLLQTNSTSFAPYSYSVVANNCISGHSFAHELGHNMGCNHDAANTGNAPVFPYAYGWRWHSGASQYRSVMAYAPGSRVPYFSNPGVSYLGTPTGDAAVADNARTIRETAPSVANFRQRGIPSAPILMASAGTATVDVPAGSDKTQILQFGNAGSGTANYILTDDASWLTISPVSGSATALVSNAHTLEVDADSLAIGTYNAIITMSDPAAGNNPVKVPLTLHVHEPVLNDDFVNATVITGPGGTITGTNQYATRQAGEPNSVASRIGQKSIWYKWTAASNLPVTFDTQGSTFDTVLAAYTGSLGFLTSLGENDNASGISPRSRIMFTPVPATTYYILIDSANTSAGNTTLNWSTPASVQQWQDFGS